MMPYPNLRYAQISQGALISGLLLSPGTGGDVSVLNIERLKNPPAQHSHPFVSIHQTDANVTFTSHTETLSEHEPLEDLNHIMTVLNPNISELAKVLHVSRQAIYKWKNGEGVSQEYAEKLHGLARAADVFAEAGLTVNPFMLRRTVTNSQSFLEIVESGGSAIEAARTLVQIVQIGQRQRDLIDQRLATKETRKTVSIIEEFPLPYEDD